MIRICGRIPPRHSHRQFVVTHRLLKAFRTLHLYLGVFTAPALLFFAITGGLQSFGLHETSRDGSYRAPMWLQSVAHLHKKQSLDVPVRKAPPPRAGAGAGDPAARAAAAPAGADARAKAAAPAPQRNLLPMKIYFALVSLALAMSTLTGVYMASRFPRDRRRFIATLAAGFVVPGLLLLF